MISERVITHGRVLGATGIERKRIKTESSVVGTGRIAAERISANGS